MLPALSVLNLCLHTPGLPDWTKEQWQSELVVPAELELPQFAAAVAAAAVMKSTTGQIEHSCKQQAAYRHALGISQLRSRLEQQYAIICQDQCIAWELWLQNLSKRTTDRYCTRLQATT